MENIKLDTSVQYLKGVGPKMFELLNKLNIYTVKDLLEYYPRVYEDRTKITPIDEFEKDKSVLFFGTLVKPVTVVRAKGKKILSTVVTDDSGAIAMLTWFNQVYIKDRIKEGETYLFYGKVSNVTGSRAQLDSCSIYNVSDLSKIQGLYPIYSLTAGITQNYLFKLVNTLMDSGVMLEDIFSEDFRRKYSLAEVNYAARNIHFPKDYNMINLSRNRVIFEELFLFQLALLNMKNKTIQNTNTNTYKDLDESAFLKLIPFELTNAQKKVVSQIKNDMASNVVMNRLVQGDVGSGKTMVAAIAMYLAVKNGYQACLMAPTTILANQHYLELSEYFSKLGLVTEIITSSTTKKQKEKIIERLKAGQINILIGTHSVIEDNIEFNNLGLVVTDEQHRFGVKQRMKLSAKGNVVDTIVMTATPIPRTLAIILYGDLDLSVIDELPPGRKPVETYVVNDSDNERLYAFLRKQINEGRQTYVVCPLVEENEDLDLNSVEKLYEEYKKEFSEYNVAILHGKMKNKEKDQIMHDFKDNKINILISTTVIEVGISVPNATLMIIENADRFGLAALHQLRGRVGRGSAASYCILKSNNKSPIARQRLDVMRKSNDGFEIAQKDLELRGPGDFFGIRQSGMPEFKLANLLTDNLVLEQTQEAVKEIMQDDPKLEKAENLKIKRALYEKYGEQINNIVG